MDSPPVPLPRVKSPPWHMNSGITRWTPCSAAACRSSPCPSPRCTARGSSPWRLWLVWSGQPVVRFFPENAQGQPRTDTDKRDRVELSRGLDPGWWVGFVSGRAVALRCVRARGRVTRVWLTTGTWDIYLSISVDVVQESPLVG
jgi:hypothetical protein